MPTYQGKVITLEDGFYRVTLGDKTFYRAKLSNLETIINMYNQGGELQARVINNIPETREEWLSTVEEETLATGKVVEVVTKTPVHPDKNYNHVFESYQYVPEYGKGAEAVRKRAKLAAETEYGKDPSVLDRILGLGIGAGKAIKNIQMPKLQLPQISLFTKGVGLMILILVGVVVLLIAIGYSGLGGAMGSVAEREHKKHRGKGR